MLIKAVALCEELQDYVSRDLLEELLVHCEQAIDWLETQESLIKEPVCLIICNRICSAVAIDTVPTCRNNLA